MRVLEHEYMSLCAWNCQHAHVIEWLLQQVYVQWIYQCVYVCIWECLCMSEFMSMFLGVNVWKRLVTRWMYITEYMQAFSQLSGSYCEEICMFKWIFSVYSSVWVNWWASECMSAYSYVMIVYVCFCVICECKYTCIRECMEVCVWVYFFSEFEVTCQLLGRREHVCFDVSTWINSCLWQYG